MFCHMVFIMYVVYHVVVAGGQAVVGCGGSAWVLTVHTATFSGG